jgi:hypothetical protein
MIDQPIIAVKMLGVLRTLLAKVEFPIHSQSQPFHPTLGLLKIFNPYFQSMNAQ